MSLTHFLLFSIGWRANGRRFVPQKQKTPLLGGAVE